MHILVIPSWYPTPEDPISGCFFREQAQALADYGHRVSVFAYFSDAPKGVYTEKTVSGNMTEFRIHVKPVKFHLTYFVFLREMLRLLRTELKDCPPEIIHAHSFYALRYGKALRTMLHIPLVCTEHATWFERHMLSERELRQIRRDFDSCDAVLAVSPGLREHIRPYCTNKDIQVVPNMVSDRFFEGGLRRDPGETFGFISVGGMLYKKGFDILLEAFDAVHKRYPNTRLTVCGGEDKEQNYPELVKRYDLGDAFRFTGRISREECAQYMHENQIFVLPSRAETFGVVYIEAMACGLPIIQTKIGAWTMLTTPETGLAVDTENVSQLVEAMISAMEHYDSYDPQTIRSCCRENFSGEGVARQLTGIYESLTAQRKG